MILDIPFYPNTTGDGNQCQQICAKSVLEYFLHEDYSLDELDQLTGRKKDYWTYIAQVVCLLYDKGLEVQYYAKSSADPFLEGEESIREFFGKDAGVILKHTDLKIVIPAIKRVLKLKLFKVKELSLQYVRESLKINEIPIITIDWNTLVGNHGEFVGHTVVVTGFEKDYFYIHESGPENPEPNKKIANNLLLQAWNHPAADKEIVIVKGKR